MRIHEYFQGESGRGVGASHQTGWTAVVANLFQQSTHSATEPQAPGSAMKRRSHNWQLFHECPS